MLSSVNGAGITLHSLTFLWIQPDLHRITTHQYEWKRHEWFKNGAKAESVTGAAPPWVVLGAPHRCSNRWQLFCLSLIAHDADKQLTKQCDAKIILHLCKLYCWIRVGESSLAGVLSQAGVQLRDQNILDLSGKFTLVSDVAQIVLYWFKWTGQNHMYWTFLQASLALDSQHFLVT